MNNEFDIIIPIGPNCKPTYYIRENGLRKYAYPFDWQIEWYHTIIHLFKTDFSDFFVNYEDATATNDVDPGKRCIKDITNDIRCMHYVTIDDDIDEAVNKFRDLMIKRYNRLKKQIVESKRILLISCYNESVDNLKSILTELDKLFPNKIITLVNVFSTKEQDIKEEYNINNNLKLIMYYFDDENSVTPKWIGNSKKWNEILSQYSINLDI